MSARVVLESNLYRRDSRSNATFQYHNHVLVGTRLYFVVKQSKPSGPPLTRVQKFVNSASGGNDFRLILVQGTRKGRLCGIKLFQHSEITVGKHTPKAPTPYIINVSGIDQEGLVVHWSLACANDKERASWQTALTKARDSIAQMETSAETERLRELGRLMKGDLKLSTRFHRFKLYRNCFSGEQAVGWISKERKCNREEAVSVGMQMYNLNIFEHISHEHLFLDGKLLYCFSDQSKNDRDNYLAPFRALSKLHRSCTQELHNSKLANGMLQLQIDELKKRGQTTEQILGRLQTSKRRKDLVILAIQVAVALAIILHQIPEATLLFPFLDTVMGFISSALISVISKGAEYGNRSTTTMTHKHTNHVQAQTKPARGPWGPSSLSPAGTEPWVFVTHEQLVVAVGVLALVSSAFLLNMGAGGLIFDEARAMRAKQEEEERLAAMSVDLGTLPSRAGAKLVDSYMEDEDEDEDEDDDGEDDEDDDDDDKDLDPLNLAADFDDTFMGEELAGGGMPMHDDGESSALDGDGDGGESEEDEDYYNDTEEWGESDAEDYYDEDDEDDADTQSTASGASLSVSPAHGASAGARLRNRTASSDSELESNGNGLGTFSRHTSPSTTSGGGGNGSGSGSGNIGKSAFPVVKPRSKASVAALRASLDDMSNLPHPKTWNSPILVRRSAGMIKKSDYASLSLQELQQKIAPKRIHGRDSDGGSGGVDSGSSPASPAAAASLAELQERTILSRANSLEIDSDYFKGFCNLLVADLPDSPHNYFKSKKRRYLSVFQGRFTKSIPFHCVYTGQALSTSIEALPSPPLVSGSLKVLGSVQPGLSVNLKGEKPFVLTPLVAAAQAIIITPPSSTPPNVEACLEGDLCDDLSVLGPKFRRMTARKRMRYFGRRKRLEKKTKYMFDTEHTYTFTFYSNLLDLSTFRARLGVFKYDLTKVLGTRPIQLSVVAWDPVETKKKKGKRARPSKWPFVWNIEVWNERSIPEDSLHFLRT